MNPLNRIAGPHYRDCMECGKRFKSLGTLKCNKCTMHEIGERNKDAFIAIAEYERKEKTLEGLEEEMETVEVKMQLPKLPEGFEYTGEFRAPKNGEWYWDNSELYPNKAGHMCKAQRHILRTPEVWRDAEVPTVGNFKDWGKKARFSDDGEDWCVGVLRGYEERRSCKWWSQAGGWYKHCQVLEED